MKTQYKEGEVEIKADRKLISSRITFPFAYQGSVPCSESAFKELDLEKGDKNLSKLIVEKAKSSELGEFIKSVKCKVCSKHNKELESIYIEGEVQIKLKPKYNLKYWSPDFPKKVEFSEKLIEHLEDVLDVSKYFKLGY